MLLAPLEANVLVKLNIKLMLKNCPQDYYDNCTNAVIHCKHCSAGSGSSINKLKYQPADTNLPIRSHPAYNLNKKVTKQGKYSKSGRRTEHKITQNLIQKTINSGALLGDADIKVGNLKLDIKKRHNTNSFTLTTSEYKQGLTKDYHGWIIENKNGERVYILREDVLLLLMQTLQKTN